MNDDAIYFTVKMSTKYILITGSSTLTLMQYLHCVGTFVYHISKALTNSQVFLTFFTA